MPGACSLEELAASSAQLWTPHWRHKHGMCAAQLWWMLVLSTPKREVRHSRSCHSVQQGAVWAHNTPHMLVWHGILCVTLALLFMRICHIWRASKNIMCLRPPVNQMTQHTTACTQHPV
jgi:hypothetical protein